MLRPPSVVVLWRQAQAPSVVELWRQAQAPSVVELWRQAQAPSVVVLWRQAQTLSVVEFWRHAQAPECSGVVETGSGTECSGVVETGSGTECSGVVETGSGTECSGVMETGSDTECSGVVETGSGTECSGVMETGSDLQCTVNQHKQVTCLWDQQGVPKENYTLKYWFDNKEDSAVLCPKYLLNESIHIGCWIQEPIETFTPFTALLISSNLEKTVQRKYNQPQNFVKLDPPNGLQVANTSSMELILKWDVSNSSYPNRCIEFQVQYKSSTDRIWTVKEASTFLFSLPSYDPEKMYTFHVRSKLSNSCSGAKTWSEWSVGVSWGRNTTIIGKRNWPA
ncbi:cytokine receptor common subunit gamma [Pelobates cultripes]|uniref:Cytokine receptor common subunit gamma n=1 Tax=Pelobates cultripes TaxID=61616 RepID=A0AAD1T608_PELCU|nr:cytokine receptor common subunit gamma [Pelobates cultripes]